MELFIAGGCGEHGRNCFYVEQNSAAFLVDCGLLAGAEDDLPRLTAEQIQKLRAVFLTHSHADPHRGAAVAGAAGVSGAGLCYAAYSDPTALFLESYPNAGKSLPLQRLRLCAGTARPAGHMGAFRALRRQRLAAI